MGLKKVSLKKVLLIIIGFLLLSVVGLSYAYWLFTTSQKSKNIVTSDCFEVTLSKESDAIFLDKAHSVTDEEGMNGNGYTFTIENTCNTIAFYQVNLEKLKLPEKTKALPEKYIKLSLNNNSGRNVTDYETVEKTIDNAVDSHKLTSGSLQPSATVTYTLKLWMDYNTPADEENMEATFKSKISVVTSYMEEEKLQNDMETLATSQNEDFSNESETITIRATSQNYKLIEYSFDEKKYEPIIPPKKEVEIEKTFDKEGEYSVYFKDEVGNIQEEKVETTKLDQTSPTVEIEESKNESGAILTIHLSDAKSGLSEYKIEDGVSAIDLEEESWKPLEGNNKDITYQSMQNKNIVIQVKDAVGNIKEEEHKITNGDGTGPSILVTNPKENGWSKEPITVQIEGTDDLSGIKEFYYKKEEEQDWKKIESANIEGKTGSASVTFETEEEAVYQFKIIDQIGNESEIQTTTIKIDHTAPEVSEITNEMNDVWTSEDVTIRWSVEENGSGIATREWSTDQLEWNTITEDQLLFNTTQENTIYIKVTDEAGNESDIKSTKVKVDKSAGSASFKATEAIEGSNQWYRAIKIQVTALDNESGITDVK